MSQSNAYRTWRAIIEDSRIGLSDFWDTTVLAIAMDIATQRREAWEKNPGSEEEPPIPDGEIDASLAAVIDGEAERPTWWPTNLKRCVVRVSTVDEEGIQESSPKTVIELSARSCGRPLFMTTLDRQLDAVATPFTGRVTITVETMAGVPVSRKHIQCSVGIAAPGRGGSRGNQRIEVDSDYMDYLKSQNQDYHKNMASNLAAAGSVIQAAGTLVHAARGVNAAPPWAQGGNDGGDPLWLKLGLEALRIVAPGLGLGAEALNNATQPRTMVGPQPQAIPMMRDFDPAGPPPPLDTGVPIDPSVPLLEPEDPYMMDEPEEAVEIGDEGEEADDSGENPLDRLSPEELQAYLEQWIDNQPDKNKVRTLGMSLARKVL